MDNDAPCAGAALAGCADGAEKHGPLGQLEVGGGSHNDRIVAPEFEQGPSETLRWITDGAAHMSGGD